MDIELKGEGDLTSSNLVIGTTKNERKFYQYSVQQNTEINGEEEEESAGDDGMMAESNKNSRTMMLSNIFPDDFMIDICSRLPVKSLLRFKCVSKSWQDLITDRWFANHHLSKQHNNSNFKEKLVFYRGSLYMLDYQKSDQFKLVNHEKLENCTGVLASCNGLLLCSDTRQRSFYIWNPCLGEHHWLKCPLKGFIAIGFGCDSDDNDYKVVLRRSPWCYKSNIADFDVYVYSLYKRKWRRISETPYFMDSAFGVSVNGYLHWRASATSADSWELITAFHIGGETFAEVPLPAFIITDQCLDFKILEFQGSLGVACGEISRDKFEIWVMKDYGVRESWAKLFTVEFARLRSSIFTEGGLILMHGYENGHSSFVLYDPKEGSSRKIGGAQSNDFLWVQSYADSIVGVDRTRKRL